MSGQSTSREEVRFAVVLNGGVSLAVWMGGVVLELDRLTRQGSTYQPLLDLVGCTARADVISGTSAGGINGAALALSQVNKNADLTRLRDLWAEQGRMEQLLRTPFRGQPASLLKGDEFFYPRLQEALDRLTADFEPTEPYERPIDLRITTTLLGGVPTTTYDDLGQPLTQSVHQGSFSFRRDPYDWVSEDTRNDFTPEALPDRVRQLALAARSSASFPFAFEPSFIPVGGQATPDRPDMADVASWAGSGDRSRYAVDGGVLVNTPTREALDAIDRMPADGPVRRVMLLVFPHAEPLGSEPQAHDSAAGFTTISSGARLLTAMTSQAGRTYVEKIEEHNRRAAASRGGRMALLERLHASGENVVDEVYSLADKLFGHYEDVEIRLAARQVTAQQFALPGGNPANWSFERARRAAESAQRAWKQQHGVLPYVPGVRLPSTVCREDLGWEWGLTMAERLCASVLDLHKRLVWVVPDGEADAVARSRRELHQVRAELRRLRTEVFAWKPSDSLGEEYWTGRLAAYHEQMIDGHVGLEVKTQVAEIGRIAGDAQRVVEGLDEHRLKLGGLLCWHALLATPETGQEAGLGDAERWLSRLLALEVAGTCLSDDASTGLDTPVELVQVSLQTRNAFAQQSVTADDKAGGASLSRFSGFLKRSWRVNDWIWGRLDGATMLCRVLFDPRRLLRMDQLGRPDGDDRTPRQRAQAVVDQVVAAMFGPELPIQVARCAVEAAEELTGIYRADGELSPSSLKLAELAAWGLHWRIICEELPRLRAAIIADRGDGADERSRGELFLAEHADLLRRLDDPRSHTVTLGMSALAAFDRAGIGREPLTQEAASDQMIRTAATAAAVAVTVADSERLGIAAVRPVTRVVRGAALLPYWTITGLTRGGTLARFLGLLGLAVGGALVVMALFGMLPSWAAGPGAAVGAASLLAAFGYAALRSGTLLHGLVLLSPVIPLVATAVDRLPGDRSALTTGTVTVAGVAVVVVALLVLGSLPSPIRTPLAVLADFRPLRVLRRRWKKAAVVAGVAALAWAVWRFDVLLSLWLMVPATVLSGAFGAVMALSGGKSLQRWRRVEGVWGTERAEPPAAATAGWAVVYGVGYLVVADVLIAVGPAGWGWRAVIGTALLFGLTLLLVTSWYVPRTERRRIRRQLVDEAIPAVYPPDRDVAEVLRERLEGHASLYRFLVDGEGEHPDRLTLSPTGLVVAQRIERKLHRVLSGRTTSPAR
ncbi:patatin-related protein [Lentzea fradiae]|uniref:Patatin-related protein n=1 Tax=Lentzea fradiae TaxID=200378 RepID=A0A1G8DI85_9PSEU|nr:patatin-like protein [Lentzea fradiae]SDH57393.1 patatin-related protein [Lentzea fradiae]